MFYFLQTPLTICLLQTPVKSGRRKQAETGIYEPLQEKTEVEDFEIGVLCEEEGLRANRSLSLARGTHIKASLSRAKW